MRKHHFFPTVMKSTAAAAFLLTAVFSLLYRLTGWGWILSGAITAFTCCYHFAIRLLVGTLVPHWIRNPMQHRWFHPKAFEAKLYEVLKVKCWKDHMPTYDPASFSLRENTLEQVVHNCCVSEAVHEVIILFSFVPLVFAHWWDAFPVFLITSVLAALFDCSFALIQRYNRPRLVRILAKKEAKAQ